MTSPESSSNPFESDPLTSGVEYEQGVPDSPGSESVSPRVLANATPVVPERSRPRVWSPFVLLFVVFGIIVAAQTIGAVGFMLFSGMFQLPADQLQSRMTDVLNRPGAFIFLGLLSQIPILAGALVAAHLSPEPFRERLKLHAPNWSLTKYGLAAVATIAPTALGLSFASALQQILPADESVATLYQNMTWPWVVPFLLFISLLPGFGEELLFRGYMQGRLLKRLAPFWAIGVTSLLFSLFHLTPHAIVFTFPIGIWLGLLAWQTNSVWPGIVCHAFLNFAWNVLQIGNVLLKWGDEVAMGISWIALAAGVIAMVILLRQGLVAQTPGLR